MTRSFAAALAASAVTLLATAGSASATSTFCCIPWQEPGEVVASPDSKNIYVSDNNVALAVAVDPGTGDLTLIDTYDSAGEVAEISPDGRHVYFAGRSPRGYISVFARDANGSLTALARAQTNDIIYDLAASPDGRQLYAADARAGAVIIFDRDPDTGALTSRGSVTVPIASNPPWGRLKTLELSPDGKFLYAQVNDEQLKIVTLQRGDDGSLAVAGELACNMCGLDLAISPDGRYLFDDSHPTTIDRDTATGALSNPRDNPGAPRTNGKPEVRDGRMDLSPDGKSLYMLDAYDDRVLAASVADGVISALAIYREAVDGVQGLRDTQSLTVSPDGGVVFVASGVVDAGKRGRITSFRRDPATGLLTFADLLEGPNPQPGGSGPNGAFVGTMTINNGATYTNDPRVKLTISGFERRGVAGFAISNDGGFGAGTEQRWLETSDVYDWTLASSGPERLPKTVYARAIGPQGAAPLIDDIILDERDPVVQYVEAPAKRTGRSKRMRLKVRARDTLSGVAKIQVTTNKRKPGAWKKYTSKPLTRTTRRALYVRVGDRAGNASRWQKAKVKR